MAVDNLTAYERETVLNMSDGDKLARIWTAQLPLIRACRSDENWTEIRSGYEGTSEWAEFVCPRELLRLRTKKRLSEDERALRAERGRAQLAAMHAKQAAGA